MTLHHVINLVREVPDLATFLRVRAGGVFASVLGGEQLLLREGPRPRVSGYDVPVGVRHPQRGRAVEGTLGQLALTDRAAARMASAPAAMAPSTIWSTRSTVAAAAITLTTGCTASRRTIEACRLRSASDP